MTTVPRGSVLLVTLTAVLVLAEGALAIIALLVWNVYRHGSLTGAEAAPFILLGVSAVAGVVILLLALLAFAGGDRAAGMARLASGLAWLRLLGVLVAVTAVAIGLAGPASGGLFALFGAVLAVVDALLSLAVTRAAIRRQTSSR